VIPALGPCPAEPDESAPAVSGFNASLLAAAAQMRGEPGALDLDWVEAWADELGEDPQ
jgi:hypothetical protein